MSELSDEQIEAIAEATFAVVQEMPDAQVNGSTWDRTFARAVIAAHEAAKAPGDSVGASVQVSDAANAAIRTLEALRYSWEGGEQWKPPLGPHPFARTLVEPTAEELRKAFDDWRKNTCPEFDPDFESHRGWAEQFAWFAVKDVTEALQGQMNKQTP